MNNKTVDHKMLFLFGMPRSGTTWLGKIFDSHPDVLYLHEPDSEIKIEGVPILETSNDYDEYKSIVSEYCSRILDQCTIRTNGKTPFFKKSYLSGLRYFFLKINLLLAKVFEKIGLSILIWNPFKESIKLADATIAWKSIESCGRLGHLIDIMPECKAIYIIRHPCGQIASVIKGEKSGNFSSKESSSEDYPIFQQLLKSDYAIKHDLTMDKIKQMSPIERLAIRWVLYNEQAIDDVEKSQGKGMVVRYEDLCCNPEGQGEKLFEFSELNWNAQTEQFVKQSTQGGGGYYSVNRNPKEAMNKWKKVFSEEEISTIKNIVSNSKAGQLFSDCF